MRIVCSIPIDARGSNAVRAILDALVQCWTPYLRERPLPPLYSSGIRYQREPNAGEFEHFKSPYETFESGWGDCDDLVIYRLCELRAAGEPATVQVLRLVGTGKMHVRVRRANGIEEDPSIEVDRFKDRATWILNQK